ncbi:hypothetical protein C2G38_2218413 [Gigaspora rosea]|uniref:Uncharacterized protein n=1 Tax=Gigaspora rosea TaxID=44941 RepID=A0A397U6P5_9GLOM|nr:hypothetical protein C2G38_2218413 [Gigaspora rosea]
MLVHAIQKRLPLHFSRLEKQLVKFPCENADNILSEIFEDQQWGTRFYDSGQCAYVILYIENSNQQQLSLLQKKILKQNQATGLKLDVKFLNYFDAEPQTAGELASILIWFFQDLEDEATELYVYKQATDLDANFPTYNQVKSSRFLNCSNSKPASQPSQLSQRINYYAEFTQQLQESEEQHL